MLIFILLIKKPFTKEKFQKRHREEPGLESSHREVIASWLFQLQNKDDLMPRSAPGSTADR